MHSAHQGQAWKTPGKEPKTEPPSEEEQRKKLPFWCKQCDLVKKGDNGILVCTGDDIDQNHGCHYGIQKHFEALHERINTLEKQVKLKKSKNGGHDNGE
jgi:hypothetical protein